MKARAAIILSALTLSACSTILPPEGAVGPVTMAPGAELIGRTVQLQTANGQTSTLHFAENGVVHAQFGSQQVQGNWVANGSNICFAWAGAPRECWPYTAPFRAGQTVSLTSDRGNQVRVTLQ